GTSGPYRRTSAANAAWSRGPANRASSSASGRAARSAAAATRPRWPSAAESERVAVMSAPGSQPSPCTPPPRGGGFTIPRIPARRPGVGPVPRYKDVTPRPARLRYAGGMRTLLLLAAAVLPADPRPARADPELDRALALHRAGKHAEALAAVGAHRQQLPAAARLLRWSISFERRAVPVALIGAKLFVITSPASP